MKPSISILSLLALLIVVGCEGTPQLTLSAEAQQQIMRQYVQRGVPTRRRNIRLEVVVGQPTSLPKDNNVTQVVCVKVRFEDDENGAYVSHVRSVVAKHIGDAWLAPTEGQADWQQYACPAGAYESK